MLQDIVLKGSTDRSVTLRCLDSTTGAPKTDVVFNTAGINLWYRREGAALTSITEATLAALTTAHADGGFLHVSDGVYRLDLPDAAFASGANYVDFGGAVTGGVFIGGRVRLVDVNIEDTVRAGLTALPNAAAAATGGLFTRGTGAGQINQDANGRIDVNITAISADATAADNLETAFDDTAGAVPWLGIVDQGTAQSASSSGLVLRAAAAFADDTLIGAILQVFGSTQGYWQTRQVIGNALSGDSVTVDPWAVTPSGTITYRIWGGPAISPTYVPAVNVTQVNGSAAPNLVGGRFDANVGAMAANTMSAAALATDAVAEIQSGLATAADLASVKVTTDKLDDTLEDQGGGTFGFTEAALQEAPSGGGGGPSAADIADAVLEEAVADHSGTSGSTAEALALLVAATSAIYDRIGAPAGASLAADVAAVKGDTVDIEADTQDIQGRLPAALISGRIDATVGAMQTNVMTADAAASDLTTELQSGLATAAALDAVDGKIDAIGSNVDLIKASTDNLPASPAAVSDIPTVGAIADAVHDEVVEGTTTLRQSMRLHNAVLGGKASGLATTSVQYRDLADTKDVIDATVDSDGNRSAVTRDLN